MDGLVHCINYGKEELGQKRRNLMWHMMSVVVDLNAQAYQIIRECLEEEHDMEEY